MLVAVTVALTLTVMVGPVSGAERKMVVAYVPNWIDLKNFATQIPYERVTHLNVAFENPVNDEGELSYHVANAVLLREAKRHGVKVCVSMGGGSASGDKVLKGRYARLLGTGQRGAFAQRLVAYVERHGFDGLDVDIEGPSITEDYGPFIAVLAPLMKAKGYLLTAALSKGYGGDRVPDAVLGLMDYIHIMAYDGAGYWSPDRPGQHSSLEFAKESVDYWLKRGLPPAKAVLGVPFYGYGFGEAFKKRDYPYATILSQYPDAATKDQVGNTIWYNGIPTIQAKTRFALEKNLAGVMIWSLDLDVPGPESLLRAIDGEMRGERKGS